MTSEPDNPETLRGDGPLGLYVASPTGHLVVVSSTLARMLGYACASQLHQANLADFSTDAGAHVAFLTRVAETGELHNAEHRLRRVDGSTLTVRESAFAVRGADGIIVIHGAVTDISPVRARRFTPPATQASPAGSGLTVLLVEDDDAVRQLLARSLRAHGCVVNDVASAQEAIARADLRQHDVLVTDVVLPGMGGPELAEEFTAANARAGVVFMSGYLSSSVPQDACFLRKPFTTAALLHQIGEAVRRTGVTCALS